VDRTLDPIVSAGPHALSKTTAADMTAPPAFWSGRRVLITGASGLIGSELVDTMLRAGAEVTGLLRDNDRRSPLFRSGNIHRIAAVRGVLESPGDVERALAESDPSVVFHLGAQTQVSLGMRAPLLTFESNVRGTYNVLDVCRRHSVERVVVASSDKAYGFSDNSYTEESPLRARFPYDVSKAVGDLIAQSYYASFGLRVAILRCGNTFGGGDLNWGRIIPGTIRSFHYGRPPEIRSDGTFVRDYIYVADVASAYCAVAEALERPDVAGQAFNVAAGHDATVLEVVSAIREIMGGFLPEPRILNTATGEIRDQRLDWGKVRRLIGWSPRVSLRDGLRDTIAWYRSYLSEQS
jgi:CDP-glucose 4,6-dehydratase